MSAFFPDKEEFIRRAQRGNMTPVYKEILADMETPVSAFKKLMARPMVWRQFGSDYVFLLERHNA